MSAAAAVTQASAGPSTGTSTVKNSSAPVKSEQAPRSLTLVHQTKRLAEAVAMKAPGKCF